MGFLQNNWINYIDRSYQQIKEQVLTALQSRVPEITDHTESNIFVKMISIWSGVAEMLGYYIDSTARETFLDSARLYKSVIKIAKMFDYRVRANIAASANLRFTASSSLHTGITIPAGTIVENTDGIRFLTTEPVTIPAGETTAEVSAEQSVLNIGQSIGTSNGSTNQTFELPLDIVDGSVLVKVGGVAWTPAETFAFSNSTSQIYVVSVNELGVPIIKFGDGIVGQIPNNGVAITADYKTTLAEIGNVGANTITNLISTLILPTGITISVNNVERASSGRGIEDINDIKRNIPLALRTKYRAVTYQDYIDVTELAAGVAKAGVSFSCGKKVHIFVVPEGGGIATTSLLNSTKLWLEERKMITTAIEMHPAGEIHILLDIALVVKPQYTQSVVVQNVKAALTDFISYKYQDISGRIEIGDIYEVIEKTEGVDYSRLQKIVPVPYAIAVQTDTPALDWSVVVTPNSLTETTWYITVLNTNEFQVLKNGTFVGNFTFGALVQMPEVEFTVNNVGYSINDSWTFKTYKYNDSVDLNEPSLPVSLDSDITITATGGI